MRWLPFFLLACTGSAVDDSGSAPADTDTDTDTDTDPRTAEISGSVIYQDGTPAADFPMQVCSLVCRYTSTDAAGNFSQAGLEAAKFKVDAVGAEIEAANLGNGLVGVTLAEAEVFAIQPAIVVPAVEGPVLSNKNASRQTYAVGRVSLTFAGTDLELPFGAADRDTGAFDLYAGVLEGAEIPAFWSVTPAFAVTLLPWAVRPAGPMDIGLTGLSVADGSYSVYALSEYGEVEGPLGTVEVAGGAGTASAVQLSSWTWVLFVP